jgi:non-heme chloroperoxidase
MRKWIVCTLLSLAVSNHPSLEAQSPGPWRDPSSHQATFVTVADGVNLEVLDWGGGSRQAVVLLTGSGNSAHVFDEFAPKLLNCCHVYGITRRGHGVSSRPEAGYHDQQLADDVLQVLDRLKLDHPVLIGHSAAGGEMTTLARQHSDRLGGLVYMDAIGDLEDDPPADAVWLALQQKLPPGVTPAPTCGPLDRSTFEAFRQSLGCRVGVLFPVAELHNTFEEVDGQVGTPRMPEWVRRAMSQGQAFRHDYSHIQVPALALLQFAPTADALLAPSHYEPKNTEEREAIDAFAARSGIVFGRWTDKLIRQVPSARIVNLGPVGHYLFITREAEVLREIGSFLTAISSKSAVEPLD